MCAMCFGQTARGGEGRKPLPRMMSAAARGVPTPAYASASSRRPAPSFAAIPVLMPTPVPTARAIIRGWTG